MPKLSDKKAKKILLKWPGRTKTLWPAPGGVGFWLRAQPKDGKAPGPILSSPGARLFTTQPDALWVHFDDLASCDIVAIEVCGTVQNLNDKRSRYIPASHSVVLQCSKKWFFEDIRVQKGGEKARWRAAVSIKKKPKEDVTIPVRHLRVLYALPNEIYHKWCPQHTPTGYEFFCPHSSLKSQTNQGMRQFLGKMSISSQFYVKFQAP